MKRQAASSKQVPPKLQRHAQDGFEAGESSKGMARHKRKRSRGEEEGHAPEEPHSISEVRAVYAAYRQLVHMRGSSHCHWAFPEQMNGPSNSLVASIDALLRAARGGWAARKLAARLLPTFVALGDAEQQRIACSALVKLCIDNEPHGVNEVSREARRWLPYMARNASAESVESLATGLLREQQRQLLRDVCTECSRPVLRVCLAWLCEPPALARHTRNEAIAFLKDDAVEVDNDGEREEGEEGPAAVVAENDGAWLAAAIERTAREMRLDRETQSVLKQIHECLPNETKQTLRWFPSSPSANSFPAVSHGQAAIDEAAENAHAQQSSLHHSKAEPAQLFTSSRTHGQRGHGNQQASSAYYNAKRHRSTGADDSSFARPFHEERTNNAPESAPPPPPPSAQPATSSANYHSHHQQWKRNRSRSRSQSPHKGHQHRSSTAQHRGSRYRQRSFSHRADLASRRVHVVSRWISLAPVSSTKLEDKVYSTQPRRLRSDGTKWGWMLEYGDAAEALSAFERLRSAEINGSLGDANVQFKRGERTDESMVLVELSVKHDDKRSVLDELERQEIPKPYVARELMSVPMVVLEYEPGRLPKRLEDLACEDGSDIHIPKRLESSAQAAYDQQANNWAGIPPPPPSSRR